MASSQKQIQTLQQTRLRHLKMQVRRRLAHCLRLAADYFQREFLFPEVDYDVRGTKAGVAYLQKNAVKFNRVLLLENPEEFIRQVVPHELAHLLVYQLFGRVKPHGNEWRTVMERVFGLPADTCHQFDVQSVQGKTFLYACDCGRHRLSVRRHHKVQRRHAVYICQQCKGRLIFVNEN